MINSYSGRPLKMGVTYWDTADSYGWGNNEKSNWKNTLDKVPG